MSARVYRALAAARPLGRPLALTALLRQTPAGWLLLERRPQGFVQLFEAFRARVLPSWRWHPEGPAPELGALLDGAPCRGDALSLARELVLLATAPAPFGLGLSEGAVQAVSYQGEGQAGFLTEHSRAGVLGLSSDVVGKDACPADLRRWRSHGVVAWQGRFYDPAYGHIYHRLGDAADYALAPQVRMHGGERWRPAQDRLRRTVWFREEGSRLCGPYTTPPRAFGPG